MCWYHDPSLHVLSLDVLVCCSLACLHVYFLALVLAGLLTFCCVFSIATKCLMLSVVLLFLEYKTLKMWSTGTCRKCRLIGHRSSDLGTSTQAVVEAACSAAGRPPIHANQDFLDSSYMMYLWFLWLCSRICNTIGGGVCGFSGFAFVFAIQ